MSNSQDEQGKLVRTALERNPTNEGIGGHPSYIDEESLKGLEQAKQLSPDQVKAIKSQPRSIPNELVMFFGSKKATYAIFDLGSAVPLAFGYSLPDTVQGPKLVLSLDGAGYLRGL